MAFFIRQNSELAENFQNELVRLSTFANFPSCLNVSFIKLASERFIYRGPGDRLECADCQKPFTNWRDIKSLIQKHKTMSPLCNIGCIDAHDIDTETDEASFSHQIIPMETERNSEDAVQQVISSQDICHVRPDTRSMRSGPYGCQPTDTGDYHRVQNSWLRLDFITLVCRAIISAKKSVFCFVKYKRARYLK